jgi:hypothetical protein
MSWAAVEASADTLSRQVMLGETDARCSVRTHSQAHTRRARTCGRDP